MTVLKILKALLGWAWRAPVEALAAVLTAVLAWHLFWVDPSLRAQREQAEAATAVAIGERDAERAAHIMTKRVYRIAQAEAARRDAERNARVAAQQEGISDESLASFNSRIAAARASHERLREQLAARERAASAGRAVQLPAVPAAAGSADQAPGDGLPAGDELAWRLIAQEQAVQLDALITWTTQQANLQVNP